MTIPRKKGGRPKKSEVNRKSERIVFWTTKGQAEIIENRAKEMNLTVSEFCNLAVSERQIFRPFTDDELKLKIGLVGMANNLNQIAYRANASGIESVEQSAKQLFIELKQELKKFRNINDSEKP
ncbi:mobilization protein MobC [Dyadobacter jejuensis]|uniref:Mobilization protein MobC n=1 Tax=Dyadobacter jejuensis TaxID=1082580 RepID=A0A316A6T8_9BACT|nr:plasmid mobilization relaxosome protein MobC [Dyadobacter jejuensis]PWJ53425.1 mobilization protein MobC [Dyadobacter jejuensis]